MSATADPETAGDFEDLRLLVRSRVPVIAIETHDEPRALEMLTRLAVKEALPLFTWSVTEGLQGLGFGDRRPASGETQEAEAALAAIKASTQPGLYVLCDLHPWLREPRVVRLIKDIAVHYRQVGHTLVLLSHRLEIPPEVSRLSARLELSLPDEEGILAIVREEARRWQESNGGRRVKTDSRTLEQLTRSLRGLTHADCRRLVRAAIFEDGSIAESEIPEMNRAKFELMNLDGVLSFEYRTEQFANVAGLARLRTWLEQRRSAAAQGAEGGLDRPKGVLLLGVQGAGKSLTARAIAGAWGLPLLRLDVAALYNKFIGETERNLRESLRSAELMAPCVLWLDEIEKGIAGSDSDEGTSRRVLGSLLTWMSEQRGGVFVVATANDVSALPPELLRKGRFDEIFFVDLPSAATRAEIFAIHLRRRATATATFDLPALAALAEDFSGAEIEQVVVSALYRAAAAKATLDQSHLEAEIRSTVPLAVTMAERVSALRAWASGRTVPAD